MLQQERQRSDGIPESQQMGDDPARLDGEVKIHRGRLPPASEGIRRGQPVEWIVELDGPEPGREIGELLLLSESLRVEHAAPPMGVDVARGPDPETVRA